MAKPKTISFNQWIPKHADQFPLLAGWKSERGRLTRKAVDYRAYCTYGAPEGYGASAWDAYIADCAVETETGV